MLLLTEEIFLQEILGRVNYGVEQDANIPVIRVHVAVGQTQQYLRPWGL